MCIRDRFRFAKRAEAAAKIDWTRPIPISKLAQLLSPVDILRIFPLSPAMSKFVVPSAYWKGSRPMLQQFLDEEHLHPNVIPKDYQAPPDLGEYTGKHTKMLHKAIQTSKTNEDLLERVRTLFDVSDKKLSLIHI